MVESVGLAVLVRRSSACGTKTEEPIKDHEIPWGVFGEYLPSIRNCFFLLRQGYGGQGRSNPTPHGVPFTMQLGVGCV
ncbi:MAG: hypothetical protein WC340_01970 [Kiritimatiellia bacterium]